MNDILDNIFASSAADVSIIPVMSIDSNHELGNIETPETLPILTLRNAILFPGTVIPISIGRDKSVKLINEVNNSNKLLGAVIQKDIKTEDPHADDICKIGTLGRIIKIIEMPDKTLTAIVQGVKRFSIEEVLSTEPYMIAKVHYLGENIPEKNKDMDLICSSIKDSAMQIVKLSNLPQEAAFAIKNVEGYDFLINFIASTIEIDNVLDKVTVLEENDFKERALKLLNILGKQIDLLKIKDDIQKKVRNEIDQQQREYYLNNQLKTIQEELGMNSDEDDINELKMRASKKNWPEYAAKAFEKEIAKLSKINVNSPDYNIQYSYVEYLVDLPWNECTVDNLDLKNAQKILDEDHFGLEKVKDRIIEYLAVLKLKGNMKSPILCLYGPPGVGKTSLGQSIAKALGRKYGRISLGGLHDESEIRGHRRTYIGAMPGRIINTIKRTGSSNPVIVLDEIEKVSDDFRGDPASALLEVLDPEQNTTFHDNYLDIDYDLSNVMFITTANNISTIHPALRDRMEMIDVSGYLAEEKVQIAKGYLIPKQTEAHGLKKEDLVISDSAIEAVIDEYTRESGVRGLDKQIAKIARGTAKKIALGEERKAVLEKDDLKEYLGLPTNFHDLQKGNEAPGVVTGLAWTQVGGEILFIECCTSEGKGALSTTGNLGDVMKESAVIAREYLKAHPKSIDVDPKIFSKKDMHIHVPEGAVPKDGPSAGITMVCAMASALKGKAVKKGIAMTGEMTLRGKVLPVGGIKEKILAAKRAGVDTIVLCKDNEKDINDIKEIYVKGLTFHYVETIEDVLNFVF